MRGWRSAVALVASSALVAAGWAALAAPAGAAVTDASAYTVPAGDCSVTLAVTGGSGGAGGAAPTGSAGAPGQTGSSITATFAASAGAVVSLQAGSAGAPGAPGSGGSGGQATTASLDGGTVLSAAGGAGGAAATGAPGSPGAGSTFAGSSAADVRDGAGPGPESDGRGQVDVTPNACPPTSTTTTPTTAGPSNAASPTVHAATSPGPITLRSSVVDDHDDPAPNLTAQQAAPPAPTVSSVSPQEGAAGTVVSLSGAHLDSVTEVSWGHGVVSPASFDGRRLLTTVPPDAYGDAPFGLVTAVGPVGKGGVSVGPGGHGFRVIPVISGFSPAAGYVGVTVSVTGTGLPSDLEFAGTTTPRRRDGDGDRGHGGGAARREDREALRARSADGVERHRLRRAGRAAGADGVVGVARRRVRRGRWCRCRGLISTR